MTFDLRFTFTGMMLYVPSNTQLTVLLPKTAEVMPTANTSGCGSTGEECVEPHVARITFDTAYSRPGAAALDGVVAHASLRKKRLTVPAVGSAYVKGIPSVVATATAPPRQDVLDGSADTDLIARLELTTGEASWADPGECWEYQGATRRMSHQVEWTISDVAGDWIDLELTDLAGLGSQGSLPRLYPIDGKIELWVWHAPPFELPPDAIVPELPAYGAEGLHFAHLGMLLDSRSLDAPLFRPGDCGDPPPPRDPDRGAASLGCTGAQWPVE